jgi:hypothetical protein
MSPNNGMIWIKKKKPIKFKPYVKDKIEKVVRNFIQKSPYLKKLFSRFVVRTGRVYIYKFYEPLVTSDGETINENTDEFIYLRITIYNEDCTDCSLEFENTPGRWVTVANGTLEECLEAPEKRQWLDPYS